MGLRALVRLGIAAVLGTGCAAIAGLEDPDPLPPVAVDAGAPPRARDAVDASGAAPDVGPPPCTPAVTAIGKGTVHGLRIVGAPPTIDGAFDEWRCEPRVELTTGEFATPGFPAGTKAQIAVRWTPQTIYLYAVLTTLTPGYTYPQPFENDGLTLYVGGPGAPTAAYRPGDHQIVIDHQGFTSHYRNGQEEPFPSAIAVRSASETRDTTITSQFEMALPTSVLGVGTFAPSQPYVLGIQIIERMSDMKRHEIWYRAPACGCDGGCCIAGGKNIPACDMRCNGSLVLDD